MSAPRSVLAAALLATALAGSPFAAPGAGGTDLGAQIKAAKDKVFPALVYIRVVISGFEGGQEVRMQAGGSGVVISPDGLVLTNFHVAGDGVRFLCTMSDKEEIPAERVGGDYLNDLALIRLNLKARKATGPLAVAKLGNSDALQVGDHVLAMGAPLGLARSVTAGIVGNGERFMGEMPYERGRQVGLYTNWIQHDASVLPGNSGGPLVNMDGDVVGINTLKVWDLSLAVPSNTAKDVVEKLLTQKTVPRNFFGLVLQRMVPGYADRGALIGYVFPGTPASDAGLKAGDVLLAVNGKEFNVKFEEELPPAMRRLADLAVGAENTFEVVRERERRTVKIKGQPKEDDAGRERECKALGLTVRELTTPVVLRRRLTDRRGIQVTGVKELSPASVAKPAIKEEDILRTMDGQVIESYEGFVRAYEAMIKAEKKNVLVEFERDFGRFITIVRPLSQKDLERESKGVTIKRGWIGCEVQLFPDRLGKRLFEREVAGVRVTRVFLDSPAAKAGLKVGDVIVKVGGEPVTAKREEDVAAFEEMVKAQPSDSQLELGLVRDGKDVAAAVRVGLEPLGPRDADIFKDHNYGFTGRDLVFRDQVEHNLQADERGVVVTDVERGGWAQFSGIQQGDLVMAIDRRPVRTVADLEHVMKEVAGKKAPQTLFYVFRDGMGRFVNVETEWERIK